MEVPFWDIIQNLSQALSKYLSKWIKGDKWDCFKNFSQELKKSFCLGFLWMPRETKRQNWIRLCRHLEMAKTLLHIFWNLIFIYIFWFIFSNFFFQIMRFPSSHGLMIQPTPRCSTCCQCWMLSDLCLMSDQFYHEIEKHIGYGNYLCFKLLILSNWAMFYIKPWFHEFTMNARIFFCCLCWMLSDLCLMFDQFYHEIEKHIGYGK